MSATVGSGQCPAAGRGRGREDQVRDRGPASSVVSVFRVVPSTRSSGRQGAPSCPSSPPAHYLRVAVHPRARPRPPTHPRHPPRATARQHSTRRARRDKPLFTLHCLSSGRHCPPPRLFVYPPTRLPARLPSLVCTHSPAPTRAASNRARRFRSPRIQLAPLRSTMY
jgi:hypothetical protein